MNNTTQKLKLTFLLFTPFFLTVVRLDGVAVHGVAASRDGDRTESFILLVSVSAVEI